MFDIEYYNRYNQRIFVPGSPSAGGAPITGAVSDILYSNLPANLVLVSSASGKIITSSGDAAKIANINDTTGPIQAQIDSKEPVLTKGNLTEVTSSVLTISGGTGAVIGAGSTIQVKQATGGQSGYLSSSDWNTFNSKMGTSLANMNIWIGDGGGLAQARSISGDVSITNLGVVTVSPGAIDNSKISVSAGIQFSKMENLTSDRALVSNVTGDVSVSAVTASELALLSGLTGSSLQSQLASKLSATITTPSLGDLLYYNGSSWVNFPRGTNGQILSSNATTIQWVNSSSNVPAGGSVNNVLRKVSGTDYDTGWIAITASMISDVTATASQINALSTGYYDATSSVQTQLNSKLSKSLTLNHMFVGNSINEATTIAPGTNGYVLTSVGGVPTWVSPGSGGTVTSVAASGGTTGMSFGGSPITISGTLTLTGTLAAAHGGTGQSVYAVGDILYASTTTALSKLAAGTLGYVLTSNGPGVAPSWQASAGGGGGHVIENSGTPLTARANLNFTNGLTASDNTPDTDVKLGGTLTEHTDISGAFDLTFGDGAGGSLTSFLAAVVNSVNFTIEDASAYIGVQPNVASIFGATNVDIDGASAINIGAGDAITINIGGPFTTQAVVTGTLATFEGLQYGDNYSANFVARSLIDKGYADATYAPISGGAYWSLASGGTLTGNNTITMGANTLTFTGNSVQFTPNATVAGINVGTVASNPSTTIVGDLWYRTSDNTYWGRHGGGPDVVAFAGGVATTQIPYSTGSGTGRMAGSTSLTFVGGVLTIANEDINQTAAAASWRESLKITPGAHTALTAERIDFRILSATHTWNAGSGTIATQKGTVFEGKNITQTAGTGVTFTNVYTVFVEASVATGTGGATPTFTRNWAAGFNGSIYALGSHLFETPVAGGIGIKSSSGATWWYFDNTRQVYLTAPGGNDRITPVAGSLLFLMQGSTAALTNYGFTGNTTTATSGSAINVALVKGHALASGTTSYTQLQLSGTYNMTGTYAGVMIGIEYNPTLTSMTGVTHYAFRSTSGGVLLAGGLTTADAGATITANTKLDVRGLSSGTFIARFATSANVARFTVSDSEAFVTGGLKQSSLAPDDMLFNGNWTTTANNQQRLKFEGTYTQRATQYDTFIYNNIFPTLNPGANDQNFLLYAHSGIYALGAFTGTYVIGWDYNMTVTGTPAQHMAIRVRSGSVLFGDQAFMTAGDILLELNHASKALVITRFAGDVATPVDGMIHYNTTSNTFRFRQNGAWTGLGGGGGITNGAANNELMKSDGTNAVASGLFSTVAGDVTLGTGLTGATRTISADGSASNVGVNIVAKGDAYPLTLTTTGSVTEPLYLAATTVLSGYTGGLFTIQTIAVSGSTNASDILIQAGGAVDGDGGTIVLRPGRKTGTGTNGNVAVIADYTGFPAWNAMERGMFFVDAITAPTGNPTDGLYKWVDGTEKKMKVRDEDGEIYNETPRDGTISITFDSTIAAGEYIHVRVPYAGKFVSWEITTEDGASSSVVIDVMKGTYASTFPLGSGASIAGTEKPTLSSAAKNQDTALSTWTTAFSAGDYIAFSVDSVSGLTGKLHVTLKTLKNS